MRRFSLGLASLLLATSCLSATAAAPLDRKRLLDAFALPTVELSIGLELTPRVLERATAEEPKAEEPKAEIDRLRKAMTGKPVDAEAYQRIGVLQKTLHASEEADVAYREAARLYRLRLQQEPPSSELMAKLGSTLQALTDLEGAERILRAATEIGAPHWSAWTALGSLKQGKAVGCLFSTAKTPVLSLQPRATPAEREELQRLLESSKPTTAQLERAAALTREALAHYDRTVALAPREPQAYAERAMARMGLDLTNALVTDLRKGRTLADSVAALQSHRSASSMFRPAFLEDLAQVSLLRPEDARLIALSTVFQVFGDFIGRGEQPDLEGGRVWKRMREPLRQIVLANMRRLEQLGQHRSPAVAARAWEALGMLQLMISGDNELAAKSARRAVQLDASREQAWDLLIATRFEGMNPTELTSAAKERVKARDTARNRLILTKALDKAGASRRALEEARAALKLEPMGFAPNMAVAVLLLRKDDPAALEEAMLRLDHARASPTMTDSERREVMAILAGMLALTGDVKEARANLQKLLDLDPQHQSAKRMLEALGAP